MEQNFSGHDSFKNRNLDRKIGNTTVQQNVDFRLVYVRFI